MGDGYVDSFSMSTPAHLSIESQIGKYLGTEAAPACSIQPATKQSARYGLECSWPSGRRSSTAVTLIHVVMVPYPVQGQITPMMQFAKLLTARRDDVMVTFVNNKHTHDRIQRRTRNSVGSDQSASANGLQFAWVDTELPADFNYSDMGTVSDFKMLQESNMRMKEPLKQLLQSLQCKRPPVSCVLFGTLCPWAQSAAAELGIRNFLFWTQSAALFSIYCHLPLLAANNFFPYDKKSLRPGGCNPSSANRISVEILPSSTCTGTVACIPGLPSLHASSFPTLLHVDDISHPSLATVREQFSLMGSCSGVVINSFQELEKDTWQALQQELPYPVLLVGPLLPSAFLDGTDSTDKSTGASLLQETSDCIDWLDCKQKRSVLYISFGSLFKPSTAELEGIALGIKASKQPYLWVIRPSSSFHDVSEILPTGFVEDTKDYGLIIPWAPQVQVLSHPAVGAFLTHCGWNSTLESLSMGMPMISYPILLDQPTNSACVCDVWKVGMALKRQDDGTVHSEDMERVIRKVLREDEGSRMRDRARSLRDAARQAVQARQGSSSAHIQKLIQLALPRNADQHTTSFGHFPNWEKETHSPIFPSHV